MEEFWEHEKACLFPIREDCVDVRHFMKHILNRLKIVNGIIAFQKVLLEWTKYNINNIVKQNINIL